MADVVPGLIWLVVLLAVNAFFVGAEFGVISARRSQIEPRAHEGSKAARTTLWAMEHATLMLATTQLGITVCSLLILNVSEPAIHHLLEYPLGWTGLPENAIGVIAFAVALVLVTFLHVVLGEMVPKNLSFSVPDRAALLLAPPLVLVGRVFKPVIHTLNWLANSVLRLFRVTPRDEASSTYTLDEVAGIVEQSTREGALTDTSGTVAAAVAFTAKKVAQVEVPWDQLVTLRSTATPREVQHVAALHGHSRYIVTNPAGELTGYVHLKDVLDLSGPTALDRPIPPARIRRLGAILHDADLEDALASMRSNGTHVARTVSATGAAPGVVFLEDVLEEIIGVVQDAVST